jgi:hypothetical protein
MFGLLGDVYGRKAVYGKVSFKLSTTVIALASIFTH